MHCGGKFQHATQALEKDRLFSPDSVWKYYLALYVNKLHE